MRTIIISYLITNLVCASLMAMLWLQNRKRFAGIGFWLGQYLALFTAMALMALLRGVLPSFLSMVVSNTLVIVGILLLYMGLERFAGKVSAQIHNYVFLGIFMAVHAYFTYAQPSLMARNFNAALGIFVIGMQIIWFIFRRLGAEESARMRGLGLTLGLYCLVSVARISADMMIDPGNDYMKANSDSLPFLAYQALQVALTLNLFLLVNRRLVSDLEEDIIER
jgi:hypothetical protein